MTLNEFIITFYPMLLARQLDKISKALDTGETVTAYWAGTIIRIDIKP